jgi:hypothetical protein
MVVFTDINLQVSVTHAATLYDFVLAPNRKRIKSSIESTARKLLRLRSSHRL